MKKIIIYTLSVIVFGMVSCADERMASSIEAYEQSNISPKTIVLDIERHTVDSFPLTKLIKEVRYVQLETRPEACLTVPMNIKIANDIIYVSDIDEQLFCFDQKGKFLRRAFQNGKGRGEVLRMYDYDVDDSLLYVLDGTSSSILTYQHDGTFVDSQMLPFRAINFLRQNNGYIFHLAPYGLDNSENKSLIAVTDNAFKILYTSFEYDLEKCNPVKRTPYFTSEKNSILYSPIYGRSIYEIGKDSIFMKYYLSFDGPYYEQNKNFNGAKEAAEQKIFYSYDNPLLCDKYIIQNFITSKDYKGLLLINRKSDDFMFIRNFIQDSKLLYGFNMGDTKFYDKDKKEFVGFANIYYKEIHNKEINEIRNSVTDSVSSYLIKESDAFSENPLLIFYHICPNVI